MAANVIAQYPLADSIGVAQSIFKKLDHLISEVPPKRRDAVFKPILPAVIALCETFPLLCSEATNFLLHLCKICPHDTADSKLGFILKETTDQFCTDIASNQKHKRLKEIAILEDPVFGMESKLQFLNSISLKMAACWTFEQITKQILIVSGKT